MVQENLQKRLKGGPMPAPEYRSTKRELIAIMRRTAPRGREYQVAKAFLELKTQETLNHATWAVGFATVGLIIATVVEIVAILGT